MTKYDDRNMHSRGGFDSLHLFKLHFANHATANKQRCSSNEAISPFKIEIELNRIQQDLKLIRYFGSHHSYGFDASGTCLYDCCPTNTGRLVCYGLVAANSRSPERQISNDVPVGFQWFQRQPGLLIDSGFE